MKRILCHKAIVDGDQFGPMAMLTFDDSGAFSGVSLFDGIEGHSTFFVSGIVEVCHDPGEQSVFANGKKIDINNDIY